MGASKTQIMNYLEMRYDYLSARNVLSNWRKTAGIKDEIEELDDCHLKNLLEYLKSTASDATRVHAAIERLILSDCGSCCVSAPVVEAAPVMEAAAEVAAEVVEEVVEEVAPVMEAAAEVVEEAAAEVVEEAASSEEAAPSKKKKKKH